MIIDVAVLANDGFFVFCVLWSFLVAWLVQRRLPGLLGSTLVTWFVVTVVSSLGALVLAVALFNVAPLLAVFCCTTLALAGSVVLMVILAPWSDVGMLPEALLMLAGISACAILANSLVWVGRYAVGAPESASVHNERGNLHGD